MTLLLPPQATRLFAPSLMFVVCVTLGCQTSRLATVPGMGWLSSHNTAPDVEETSLSSYPAPSAAATPTTIAESRNTTTNEIATHTNPAPPDGSAAQAVQQASLAATPYPQTQYPHLPAAPAAVPTTNPSGSYASVPNSAAGQYDNQVSNDIQDGYYPLANGGSATTWNDSASTPMSQNGNGSYAAAPNTAAPNTAAAANTFESAASGTPSNEYVNDRTASDFVAMNSGNTAAVFPPTTPSPVNPVSAPASARQDEFTRYDTPVHGSTANFSTANFSTANFSTASVSTVAQATYPAPVVEPNRPLQAADPQRIPSTYSAAPPISASHYASLAAEENQHAGNRPWQPGSTTSLPQPATTGADTTAVSNSSWTADSQTATTTTPQSGGGWE